MSAAAPSTTATAASAAAAAAAAGLSTTTLLWFGGQGASSVYLTLTNKWLGIHFPNVFLVLAIQCLATIAFAALAHRTRMAEIKPFDAVQLPYHLIIAVPFVISLVFSIKSLALVPVPLVVVARNVGPLLTAVAELLVFGRRLTAMDLLSFALLVTGAVVYVGGSVTVNTVGLVFIAINMVMVTVCGLLQKYSVRRLEGRQTPAGMTLAQNVLATPVFGLMALSESMPVMSGTIGLVMFGSAFASFGMSLCSIELQRLVAFTSITVANIIYKALTTLISLFVFNTSLTTFEVVGLAINFIGASVYGYATINARPAPPAAPAQPATPKSSVGDSATSVNGFNAAIGKQRQDQAV